MPPIRSMLSRCRTTFSVSGQPSFFTSRAAASLRSNDGSAGDPVGQRRLVGLDADLHVVEARVAQLPGAAGRQARARW